MSQPRFHRSIPFWLVPLLVLRAFVPAGYMLSVGNDGLRLSLCSGQASLPAVSAAMPDAHAAHHLQGGSDGGKHAGHDAQSADAGSGHGGRHFNSPCPFGIAAAALTPSFLPHDRISAALTDEPFVRFSVLHGGTGPARIDRIRGPPRFS